MDEMKRYRKRAVKSRGINPPQSQLEFVLELIAIVGLIVVLLLAAA